MSETLAIKNKDHFLAHFRNLDFSFDVDFSKTKREEAEKWVKKLDFPTSKTEYWKYTRVNKLIKGDYRMDFPEGEIDIDLSVPSKNCIVLVNGYFSKELSWFSAEKGVNFSSLSDAKENSSIIQKKFATLSKDQDEIFAAVNTAYHQDGAFLHLEKNAVASEPLYIIHISDSESALSNPRNLIIMEEGSEAKVVLKTISTQKGTSFTNMLTEVFVDRNANLEINKVQEEGEQDYQIACEQVEQKKDSHFKINTFTLNGALVRNNLNIDLLGEHTETWLNGLYLLQGKQHVDNHTHVFHREPNCVSHELYKGIMDDQSTGVFNGKVFVHREAQKTNAYQSNANMVLTDDATINSKPELEIYADDVQCSHGSTTGQLDEEALFYLRSRGMSEKSARAVLLNAFAADVVEHIGVESVKEEIEAFIDSHYQGIK
ncbi:MAG: Fe-S cluster assembly protein SufD [Flavobacteriales bacterium]|nr:Fe-S cluster assembly protein SufD [Flavobacteriales bacterium]|tara:strand:- start:63036 stop:64325 length:1290 start_codon:yes stop_codon:yes gene_type:complete